MYFDEDSQPYLGDWYSCVCALLVWLDLIRELLGLGRGTRHTRFCCKVIVTFFGEHCMLIWFLAMSFMRRLITLPDCTINKKIQLSAHYLTLV